MAKTKVDMEIYNKAKTRAEALKEIYAKRDENFEQYEKMYLMDWEDKPSGQDELKVTISPDARNALLGAKRLMIGTDPIPKIPGDKGERVDNADDLEKDAKRLLLQAGKAARMPIHYSAVESALLYGEVHIAITSTVDLLERMKKAKKNIQRYERLAAMTPYLLTVWNPKEGYPEFDVAGLRAYYREVSKPAAEVMGMFGELAEEILSGKKPTDDVDLGIWYDDDNYSVWVQSTPIIAEEHGLPFIPISCTVTGGSMLFTDPENQRQPLLYGLDKSEMWERENLALTVLYTNLFNIGVNPSFLHTAPPNKPDKTLSMDLSQPGGVINLEYGETLVPMATKGILDPSFQQALEIAEGKTSESTIYRQALGEPLTGSPAYSTVALLSQSGRLPLVETQKMVGEALADTLEKCMLWYREDGKQCKGYICKPKDIPENLQLEVVLDVNLPQDKLQMANIAKIISEAREGEQPLASREWARENILNIGQSQSMDEDILTERGFMLMAQMYLDQRVQQTAQMAMAQGQSGPGTMPENMSQGMTPDMMQQGGMPPEMMGAGPMPAGGMEGMGVNPAMGGMPPQMAGMVPGQGEAVMPPEGMM